MRYGRNSGLKSTGDFAHEGGPINCSIRTGGGAGLRKRGGGGGGWGGGAGTA